MERTIEALKVCASKIRRRSVTHARSVATEACRRAGNCNSFVGRVREETGIEIEIISTGEEAQLAFRGGAPLLDLARPQALAFDIRGGPTPASVANAPISSLPAAPFSRRSARCGRSAGCGWPTAACAKASCLASC